MFLPRNTCSSRAEAMAAETRNSFQKHVVRNWDGLDAKAFAGIYKSDWVCSGCFHAANIRGGGTVGKTVHLEGVNKKK